MIPETNKGLKCSADRHLFKSGIALAIYNKIGQVTKGGKREYYGSVENLAAWLGVVYDSAYRAVASMRKQGWLIKVCQTDGSEYQETKLLPKPKVYLWVSHDDWVKTHPTQCVEILEMPWEGLGDPLGRMLWTVSRGNLRWYQNQLACIRTSFPDLSDEQRVERWKDWLAQDRPPVVDAHWKACKGKFLAAIRKQRDEQ